MAEKAVAHQHLAELFNRWYVKPLEALKSLPHGDGGFVALATVCFLYERYAKAVLTQAGQRADEDGVVRRFAQDFGTNLETAQVFWKVMRNGLLHQGMPMQRERGRQTLPRWVLSGRFHLPAQLVSQDGRHHLLVQPWLIVDMVVDLCQASLPLFAQNDSFPWADIAP